MFLSDKVGYWGSVTSSVDWCEPNYVHSLFIAETLNTLSSLAMVAIGMLGAYFNEVHEWKRRLSFHIITIIGFGSVLFHMTLKYSTQMLDELPMLWASALAFAIALETKWHRLPYWATMTIILYVIAATLSTALLKGTGQALVFRSLFSLSTYTSIIIGINFYLKLDRNSLLADTFVWGFIYALFGVISWVIDHSWCHLFQKYEIYPSLHALWHVLISLGIYHLQIYSNYLHMKKYGIIHNIDLKYYYGLPFLVRKPLKRMNEI